jgi:hypothetical protein
MSGAPRDPRTASTTTISWVIVGNKPFYPIYVAWLVGSGGWGATMTLAPLPLFIALPFLARRRPLLARVGLPLVGTLDTIYETWAFGQASGVEAFLVPCAFLALLCFESGEAWVSRGLTVLVAASFVALRFADPPGLFTWPPDQLSRLVSLNLFSAASLTTFLGLLFAGVKR